VAHSPVGAGLVIVSLHPAVGPADAALWLAVLPVGPPANSVSVPEQNVPFPTSIPELATQPCLLAQPSTPKCTI